MSPSAALVLTDVFLIAFEQMWSSVQMTQLNQVLNSQALQRVDAILSMRFVENKHIENQQTFPSCSIKLQSLFLTL